MCLGGGGPAGGGPGGGGPGGGRSGGGAPKGGALKGVAPKGGTPKGGTPKGRGPKFRVFFFPPATIFFLSFLSSGSFRGILVVFLKRGALKCVRLEFSGCRVKPQEKKERNFGRSGGGAVRRRVSGWGRSGGGA